MIIIELDGVKNGIAANVKYLNSKKNKFVLDKNTNKLRLFKNLRVAKVICSTMSNIDIYIEYYFIIGKDKYSINDAQKISYDEYLVYDTVKNEFIKIKESNTEKYYKFGYFVFEDGDKKFCDKNYGISRQKELLAEMNDISKSLVAKLNFNETSLEKVEKHKYGIDLCLKDTTTIIRIFTNSKLMDINQNRKLKELKAFPFIKNMDKYLTFYFVVEKDHSEPMRLNSEEKANEILQNLISELDCKIIDVPYNGYILL